MNKRNDILLTTIIPDMVKTKYPNMRVIFVDDDSQITLTPSENDANILSMYLLESMLDEYSRLYNDMISLQHAEMKDLEARDIFRERISSRMNMIKLFIADNIFK